MAKAKVKQKEIETIAARAPAETHPSDGPSLKSHWPEKRKLVRKIFMKNGLIMKSVGKRLEIISCRL